MLRFLVKIKYFGVRIVYRKGYINIIINWLSRLNAAISTAMAPSADIDGEHSEANSELRSDSDFINEGKGPDY